MKTKRVLSMLLTLSLLLSLISIPVNAREPVNTVIALIEPIENSVFEEVLTEAELKRKDIVEDQNIYIKAQLEEKTEEVVEIYEAIEQVAESEPKPLHLSLSSLLNMPKRIMTSMLTIGTIIPATTGYFQVAIANADGSYTNTAESYTDFGQAKAAMTASKDANVVILDTRRLIGNQVVAMKNGVVVIAASKVGKSTMTFHFPGDERIGTYVENHIDAIYFDSSGSTVKMGISGQIVDGINIDEVELVPMIQGIQSYYSKNSSGDLIHSVARYSINEITNRYTGKYESITIAKAPTFMSTGVKYYSVDGENFYKDNKLTNLAGTYYPYFKYLSFRSKTNYTAEELNRYIASWNKSTSVLNGKGEAFIQAQNDFGVNAALLLAFAAHESGYGTSTIARNKNNLFGVNATDNNPYGNADVFESIETCIYNQAQFQISRGYADANTDGRYFGVSLGNKNAGLNVKYASDPYWGEKIAAHMYKMDRFLGNKDDNKYQLAITNNITYARTQANSSAASYYKYAVKNYSIPKGMPVIVTNNTNGWYEVQSDMGIDSTKTTPASYKTQYDYNISKAFVNATDFTLINSPTTPYLDPAKVEIEKEVPKENEVPVPEISNPEVPIPEVTDKVAPVISVKSGTTTLIGGGITKLNPTVLITDESTFTKTAIKDGISITWPTNNVFTADGTYAITAVDAAGNKATYTFTIDKTNPVITVKSTSGTTTYNNNSYAKTDVKVTYAEPNYASRSITKDGKTLTWTSDSIFRTDGKYIITIKDKAGNSGTYSFIIDKTSPKVIVKSTSGTSYGNGKYVKTDSKVTVSDNNYASKSITKDGKSISWLSNNTFKADGKYVITAKDKAGNKTTFTFIIDKTKPKVTVKTTGGYNIKSGRISKHDVRVTFTDKNYSSKKITRNNKNYTWPSNNIFKSNGTYRVTIKDKSGNTTTYKFILK